MIVWGLPSELHHARVRRFYRESYRPVIVYESQSCRLSTHENSRWAIPIYFAIRSGLLLVSNWYEGITL